ncbi:sensor domain-containing diguanylate cyclase [Marinobacteraceae bacterium S3BR75-40.1]
MTSRRQRRREELESELAKLNKINRVLMRQVERSMDAQGSDFTTFHKAALLEQEVQKRTRALEQANRQLQSTLKALKSSEQRYKSLIDNSIQGVVIHQDLVPLYVNQAYATMQGYPDPDSVVNAGSLAQGVIDEDLERVKAINAACQRGELKGETYEYRCRDTLGNLGWREARCSPIVWQDKQATQLVVMDISERKEKESRLYYQANYDMLTGLPNRALLYDRMHQLLLRMEREPLSIAVLFIDLDGFKAVNDSLGHALGDQLLVAAAQRLASSLRANDSVARLGGDEFIGLVCDVETPKDLHTIVDKLQRQLNKPFLINERDVHISASIGIAWATPEQRDIDTLLRRADAAMYEAKLAGRNTFAIWQQS